MFQFYWFALYDGNKSKSLKMKHKNSDLCINEEEKNTRDLNEWYDSKYFVGIQADSVDCIVCPLFAFVYFSLYLY